MKKESGIHKIRIKIESEVHEYLMNALFFAVLISAFAMYKRVLMHDYTNQNIQYGYSIIEGLILAKILVIGRAMKLGESYIDKPLIVLVIYRTITFCLLLFILHFIGYFLFKFYAGHTLDQIIATLTPAKMEEISAQSIVMIFVFSFFFSFQALNRVLGGTVLFDLFFKPRNDQKKSSLK